MSQYPRTRSRAHRENRSRAPSPDHTPTPSNPQPLPQIQTQSLPQEASTSRSSPYVSSLTTINSPATQLPVPPDLPEMAANVNPAPVADPNANPAPPANGGANDPPAVGAAAAAPPPNRRGPKFNTDGLVFSGKSEDYVKWKNNIDLYILGNPDLFTNEEQKIAWILSYMSGGPFVKMWVNRKQKDIADNGFPLWSEFQRDLKKTFKDPATESYAKEFILTFKQESLGPKARHLDFIQTLETWFDLAGLEDPDIKYYYIVRSMNRDLARSLTIAGFPDNYDDLVVKMLAIDEQERMMERPNLSQIDSRFKGTGITPAVQAQFSGQSSRFAPPQRQAHVFVNPQKGTQGKGNRRRKFDGPRPSKPNQPCWKCRDLNLTDVFHWKDQCPYQGSTVAQPSTSHTPQHRPPQLQSQQRQPRNPQGFRPRGPRPPPRANNPPQRFNRQQEGSTTDPIAQATALMRNVSVEDRQRFALNVAKGEGF